jgi:hypothetical protein
MAILVRNKSSGIITVPATYGGHLLAPGGAVVINDTEANVTAAFATLPVGYLDFEQVTAAPGAPDAVQNPGQTPYFAPARTLFVAKSWTPGVDPTVYFTTISAALLQSATLNPTDTNRVTIQVWSGTFSESLTLVSNVDLAGITGQVGAWELDGNITWLPSQGINAPQAALTEAISIDSCFQSTTATSCTIDSTGKTGGSVQIYISESSIQGFTCTGRNAVGGASDNFFIFNGTIFNTPSNSIWTDWLAGGANNGVNIVSTRFRGLTFAGSLGGTTAIIEGGVSNNRGGSLYTISGTNSKLICQGVNMANAISAAATCSFIASACNITSAMSGAGVFDVRGSNFNGNANIAGITGTCNRSVWTSSFGPTAIGANTVPIAPPYPDATYNAHLQLTAGAGNAAVTVTGKAGNQFVLTDPAVGTNTFDVTIFHD